MIIRSAEFVTSATALSACPPASIPEFAFIGRSNVGKSSLINMLTSRKGLAVVSSTPGRTRMANFFSINEAWHLVDLPGYGFAKISKKAKDKFQEIVDEYLLNRDTLTCVFVLIDSRLPPQKIDLEFTHWLMDCKVPFVLVFTKSDKTKATKMSANMTAFTDAMSEWCEGLPRIFTTSATKSTGKKELLDFIAQCLKSI